MVALTYAGVEKDFGISNEVATLGVTLFISGLGLGPCMSLFHRPKYSSQRILVFLGPLSEFFGRSPVCLPFCSK